MKEIESIGIARRLIVKHGEKGAYEIATWVLHQLARHHYCVWQTYDKEDITCNLGRKPKIKEMDRMQTRLENVFDCIRDEEY